MIDSALDICPGCSGAVNGDCRRRLVCFGVGGEAELQANRVGMRMRLASQGQGVLMLAPTFGLQSTTTAPRAQCALNTPDRSHCPPNSTQLASPPRLRTCGHSLPRWWSICGRPRPELALRYRPTYHLQCPVAQIGRHQSSTHPQFRLRWRNCVPHPLRWQPRCGQMGCRLNRRPPLA